MKTILSTNINIRGNLEATHIKIEIEVHAA